MAKKEFGSDWGRRTGRTADNKRQELFDSFSEEKKVESKLYVLDGRLVGKNTPTSIPIEFKSLLKYKFYCKYCGDYHSHSAAFLFCDKNPDKNLNLANAKAKATHHYYNKGRKGEIANANNVKKKFLSDNAKANHAARSPEKRAEINEKHRKAYKPPTPEALRKQKEGLKRVQANPTPKMMEIGLKAANIIAPSFFDHSVSGPPQEIRRDEFETIDIFNRHYDANGEFDPFS